MALLQATVNRMTGTTFPGGTIQNLRVYFSGPKVGENAFSIRRFYVTDKHGLKHACYNARLVLTISTGETVEFGLRADELKRFEATFDEGEDLIVQLG